MQWLKQKIYIKELLGSIILSGFFIGGSVMLINWCLLFFALFSFFLGVYPKWASSSSYYSKIVNIVLLWFVPLLFLGFSFFFYHLLTKSKKNKMLMIHEKDTSS